MDLFTQKRADRLLRCGKEAVASGDYITALHEFKAAAFVVRTPAALTNWGTMEHCLGDTKKAIELCEEAIALDVTCSGAYNDIGFYLVALGKADEAMPWFQRAIDSTTLALFASPKEPSERATGALSSARNSACEANEDPRQIPHINLGKLYYERRLYEQALFHFDAALQLGPASDEVASLAARIRHQVPSLETPSLSL